MAFVVYSSKDVGEMEEQKFQYIFPPTEDLEVSFSHMDMINKLAVIFSTVIEPKCDCEAIQHLWLSKERTHLMLDPFFKCR